MPSPETSRVRFHREKQLEPDEKKLVDDVEAYGCHIIQVKSEHGIPGWSYTIGLYESFQQPEVIVIGLKEDTAHFVLNEVAKLMKQGVNFINNHREKELLESVECEFKVVEQRWLEQVMGYAIWFYDGGEFPVLQCVYPDLANHFPWEVEFDSDWRARQALLFHDAPVSAVEQDFWSANDPASSLYDWKFPVPPHTGVYTTKHIMSNADPIMFVYHDLDDETWQFHGPNESRPEDATLVCFHHLVDKDKSIKELIDLPRGWRARRGKSSDPWIREPRPPDLESV